MKDIVSVVVSAPGKPVVLEAPVSATVTVKNLSAQPWWVAALASWGIALFEYLLMVPANRIGFTALSLPQLKILQEAITLAVFVPFAILYMNQPVKLDYLWAALCIMGAVYFVFRG